MRIICPTCAAEYDVPGPLAPGRAVKCARCSSKWAPIAPVPPPPPIEPVVQTEAAIPPPRPVAPLAMPMTVPMPEPAPRRWPLLLAWAGSVLVLAGVVAAAIVWREPVMAAWPPSIRLYGALGLTSHP